MACAATATGSYQIATIHDVYRLSLGQFHATEHPHYGSEGASLDFADVALFSSAIATDAGSGTSATWVQDRVLKRSALIGIRALSGMLLQDIYRILFRYPIIAFVTTLPARPSASRPALPKPAPGPRPAEDSCRRRCCRASRSLPQSP